MSKQLSTLEDFLKKYLKNQSLKNAPESYSEYKARTGSDHDRTYSRAMESLYANAAKGSTAHGSNYQNLENKGLQNSGYEAYLTTKATDNHAKQVDELIGARNNAESKTRYGYLEYLENYANEKNALKSDVMSHLIKNNVVNLDTAISYGISLGLSKEDATAIGNTVYSVTRQSVFNTILEQALNLGLDRNGAVILAKKMGASDSDAEKMGDEIEEMLRYYSNASSGYLQYLEDKSNKTTNTFD